MQNLSRMIGVVILLGTLFAYTSLFADCVTADGYTVRDNRPVQLFLVKNPKAQIGPEYNCEILSRERTCNEVEFSVSERICLETDSGGCADWWVDGLSDQEFAYAKCID